MSKDMKYTMRRLDPTKDWALTLFRYDEPSKGGADNAHREFWNEIETLRAENTRITNVLKDIAEIERKNCATQCSASHAVMLAQAALSRSPDAISDGTGEDRADLAALTQRVARLETARDAHKRTADAFGECIDQIREAMGFETTHYLVLPDDVADLKTLATTLQAALEQVPAVDGSIEYVSGLGWVVTSKTDRHAIPDFSPELRAALLQARAGLATRAQASTRPVLDRTAPPH